MLNELLQAANAIPNLPDTLHKSLKALPKTPSYKVLIDANSAIVEVIPWDDISALRKWQPGGNGFSTPVFNCPPLYRLPIDKSLVDETRNADANHWAEVFGQIREGCAGLKGSWIDAKRGDVNEKSRKSLADVLAQLLALLPVGDPDYVVLRTLLERLQRLTPERFFPEFARQIETQLASAYDEKLFGLYCAISDAEAKKSFNLLLDLPDWDEIGDYPVTHAHTVALLNALLVRGGSSVTYAADEAAPDAYGRAAIDTDDKFADINLDGLGKVILRAMTKEAPCQYRYGKVEAGSFLVGKDSRERAKSALEYLTQPGRKGKTWRYRGGSLFLFYPESESSALDDAAVADLCSLPDDDDEFAEHAGFAATFEARAERIAAAFDGKHRDQKTPVHLIVLRKPDGHRTKLVAHHTFTMRHLLDSAKAWVEGVNTCPPVAFARWGKAKGERNDVDLIQPFPYQVTKWLNTAWKGNGDPYDTKKTPNTFSVEDALTLLLAADGTERQMARRALRHALAGWAGFLITAGAREHASVVLKTADKRAAPLAALPAILSLLLFKSDPRITQGGTMTSPAFLVGRLMALADSLHLQYCEGVRNGSTPGQLLGNALVATALESPESALALYAQRILPYQAWARTCKASGNGPEALAKYFLAQLADTCAEISRHDVLQRANDTDKAQLILGYLAKTTSQPQG